MKRIFWTERQVDEVKEVCSQHRTPEKVQKEVNRVLKILDNVYGDNREVWNDDGGFILFCTESIGEKELEEILKEYHVRSDEAEYRDIIEQENRRTWEIRLYLITNDYGITIVFPTGKE